jgi:hypothetical protein
VNAPAVRTDPKKVSSVAFSVPAVPVLLNTRIRPLTPTRNCVGPTAPMLSGGTKFESALRVAPVKLDPTVSAFGPGNALRVAGPPAGDAGLGTS